MGILSSLPGEAIGVDLGEMVPLLRKIVQGENRGNGTDGHTGAAIDAFHRIDIKLAGFPEVRLIFPGMYAIDGARIHTRGILHSDAGFGYYIRHLMYHFLLLG
jgi:hypothetical protein